MFLNNLPNRFFSFKGFISVVIGAVLSGALLVSQVAGETKINSTQKTKGNLVGHGGPIKALKIDQTGNYVLTGSFDYSVFYWTLDTSSFNTRIRRYNDHDGAINAVQFVPKTTKFISAGDDGSVYLWSLRYQKLLHRFKGHQGKILSLAVSENGLIGASASWDRTVRLWDLKNKKPLHTLYGSKGAVNTVLISKDNQLIFSGGYDGYINKWEVESGKLVRSVYRHSWGINVMEWLPSKQQILFGTVNGDVQIFDLKTNSISKVLIPHTRPVLALAVSKNGKFLASGGGDGIIRVWRLKDWSLVEELNTSFGPVWAMDFADDGKVIYYAGLDDYAIEWKITPREIGKEVQGKFPRRFQKFKNMSLGERQFARKCSVCHTLKPGDQNRAGPSLFGIFGRKAGTLKSYKYSKGLLASDITWNENTIDQLFGFGPQHVTPGSKMPLQIITQKNKRQALIEFLKANTK